MLKKVAIFLSIITFTINIDAIAQVLIIDSLKNVIAKAERGEQPILMAELARASYETDVKKAMDLIIQATALAKKEKDKGIVAFCYASAGHLFMRKGQEKRAAAYIDSAMRCAGQSANPLFTGYAWLRKGWFELNKNENEKAMSAFISADKLLKSSADRRAFSYRTLINHYAASIYAYGSDTLKQHKYAIAALQMSKQSRYPDDVQIG